MSDSNNIYNILGKLEALKPTAQEKHDATVKAIYESVEAQGSIIEGVDAVQARLAQQFAEGKDEGQPGKNFEKIAKGAAERYGSKEAGERVAGAVRAKLAKQGKLEETDVEEKAPPGAKAERMVKGIKKSLSKDGHLSDKDKAIAYATTWAAHNKGQVEETEDMCETCGETMEGCGCDHTNEAEIIRKPGVTTHRKTEFPGYPADDADDLDDLRGPGAGKRGRPRKHAAKAPTGLGRGRPVKAAAPSYSKQADPFGRVSGTVPAGKKGTVHTMAESMDTLARRLIEGINFTNMMKETDQTIDELMTELQNDIKEYKATGHCSDKLKDFMQVHAHSKKQIADETAALVAPKPMAPAGGIHGNFPDPMSAKDQQAKMNPPRTLEDVTMEDELNELAKLAGLSEVSRGEYIKQQDTAAEKSGKDKFQAFGQEFDTDEVNEADIEEDEMEEGNPFGKAVRDAKADGIQPGEKIEVDGKTYSVKESTSFDGGESSDFNISTNMSSEGDKNVTVSATGDHAATLLQMLRIAGLGGTDKAQELQAEPEVEVISIDGEEGVEEEAVDVAEPATEPANAPDETYGTIKNITTQGDDLNREKSQDPATANKAANPMTNAQGVLKAVAQLESKLAAEYESIKKVNK